MRQDLESLIFCSPEPVAMDELLGCMRKLHGPEVTRWAVEEILEAIMQHYRVGPYPFEVVNLAGGYRFLTKPECRAAVEVHLKEALGFGARDAFHHRLPPAHHQGRGRADPRREL